MPMDTKNELTPRETQIVLCLISGMKYAAIAEELGIQLQTIKNILSRLYAKSNCGNKTELVTKYMTGGIVITPAEERVELSNKPAGKVEFGRIRQ